VHSDRGSQLRSRKYVLALDQADLLGSMGRVAACADNAAMELFFSLLQKDSQRRRRWAQLEAPIVGWSKPQRRTPVAIGLGTVETFRERD
jgi:putative transposase